MTDRKLKRPRDFNQAASPEAFREQFDGERIKGS
jgi:hypothetical protein